MGLFYRSLSIYIHKSLLAYLPCCKGTPQYHIYIRIAFLSSRLLSRVFLIGLFRWVSCIGLFRYIYRSLLAHLSCHIFFLLNRFLLQVPVPLSRRTFKRPTPYLCGKRPMKVRLHKGTGTCERNLFTVKETYLPTREQGLVKETYL